jgi:GGDEF domain-containing protein
MEKQAKSRQGNGSIFGAFIAALCIVIYLFALVQAVFRLYLSIEESKASAEQEFSRIVNTVVDAGTQGFMDERFKEAVNNSLALSKSIEALIISGPEGEYAFEKQQGYAVKWVNNSPRFINRLSFSNQPYQRPLAILRNVNIHAKAIAFDYAEFSKILKETLLLILIGFALSFFTMLLQMLIGKSAGKSEPVRASAPASAQAYSSAGETGYANKEENWGTETGPKGLYSPRSNIGWEEYTKDRLDSELHRCSSTEKDLTFVLMEFTDLTNDVMFRKAAEEAASFFKSRDLLFEYGKNGIAAILPGIDLEAGIGQAEKFYQRVIGKFPNGSNTGSSFCIGLSSRSGRLLNADRLLLESKEALKKARTDPRTSIIAFKSDLEKYRTFIRNQD